MIYGYLIDLILDVMLVQLQEIRKVRDLGEYRCLNYVTLRNQIKVLYVLVSLRYVTLHNAYLIIGLINAL